MVAPTVARAPAAVVLLVTGFLVGLAAVAVHGRWWGLLLAWLGSSAGLLGLRPGYQRIAYAAGWLVPIALGSIPRPTGGYAIATDATGIGLLVLGLVLVIATIVTLPIRPRRRADE